MIKITRQIICDECGKSEIVEQDKYPNKWFRLIQIHFDYIHDKGQCTSANYHLSLGSNSDPEFCSAKCFNKWLTARMKEIEVGKSKHL